VKKRKREKDFLNRSNEAKSVIWQYLAININFLDSCTTRRTGRWHVSHSWSLRGYKYSRCHLGTEISASDVNLVTGIDKLNEHVADSYTRFNGERSCRK